MSGGHFDYAQYKISEIADSIERELERQGKPIPEEERFGDDEYYTYPEDVQKRMKDGLKVLRMAEVYAQRIDWLLSGDDGEETFIDRLDTDLSEV